MATTGLFGSSPYELQQERQAQLATAADAYGRTNPNDPYGFDRARSGLYMAGSQLGGGIAGLLGAQDPAMKKAADLQSIAQEFDMTTPEGLIAGGKKAISLKYVNEGMAALAKAQELEKNQADIAAKKAQAVKDLREQDPKMRIAVAALPNSTSASIQAFMASGNIGDLERIDKTIAPPTDFIGKAVELGFGEKSKYGDYTPAQVKAVNEILLANETRKRAAGVQPVQDIARILEAQGAKDTSAEQAKAFGKAGEVYKTQVTLVPKLEKVITALPDTFTGKFSGAVTQFGKALAGAGIPIDTTKISNTEYVNSVTAQLVRMIARDFPGSQSNAELQQLLLSKPSTEQEYNTMLSLLKDVQKEMKAGTKTYERIAKKPYAERFKTDYNAEIGQTYKALQRYSELEAASRTGKLTKEQAAEAKALEELIGK